MVDLIRGAAAAMLACGAAFAADTGTLAHPDLDELSGLAVSRRDPTLLWGHNDTGSGPVLYRIGLRGEDLGTAVVPEAQSGDWEDIAAFEDAGGPALLIGDIGDNFAIRTFATLYAVRDPGRQGRAKLLWRLDFRFPDGARDCEALAVDPLAREILLITKRDRPARLYRLPLPARAPARTQTAEFVGTIPHLPPVTVGERVRAPLASAFFHSPTAFDIAADGLTAAIVTPRNAYLYRRRRGQTWIEIFQQAAARVELPRFDQIEAGALSPDGRALYIGSEGRPGRFARVDLSPEPAGPE